VSTSFKTGKTRADGKNRVTVASLAADFMGPLPSGHHLFAVVDYYSRWVEIAIMTATPNVEKTVEALEKMLTTYGLPNFITMDNGPQLINQYFKQYCEQNGIVHRRTTALWPQANGEIERQNRSFLKRLKIALSEKKIGVTSYRSTYLCIGLHRNQQRELVQPSCFLVESYAPSYWSLGIRILTISKCEIATGNIKKKENVRRRKTVPSILKTGNQVFMKQERENKLSTTFNPKPLTVLDKQGNSLLLESDEGVTYKRNITHVKKFEKPYERNIEERDQRDNIVDEVNKDASIQGQTDVDTVEIDSEKADDNISAERPVRNSRTSAKYNDFMMY
jgi:hypothetical protein